ncbi:MAG: hypothetical protein K6G00_08475 [Treponema sp.]|nr:hypothetical protein [Treponema sp.]
MEPASLDFHLPPDFISCILKAESTITDCNFRCFCKASEFQVEENLSPLDCYKLFLSVNTNPDYHEQAGLFSVQP